MCRFLKLGLPCSAEVRRDDIVTKWIKHNGGKGLDAASLSGEEWYDYFRVGRKEGKPRGLQRIVTKRKENSVTPI